MSDPEEPLGLEEAYAVETPDDNRRLYASWAATYESGFASAKGYQYHHHVAELFTAVTAVTAVTANEPVLDVGCGTGLVGLALRGHGVRIIDGVDISPEMLEQAATKSFAGEVYRDLIEADLTEPLALASDTYGGVVSAGTFTHGHLRADPLDEIVRVVRPGGRATIGVNAAHFEELGFQEWFDTAVAEGRIGPYELHPIPVFEDSSPDNPDDMSNVVIFEVR